MPELKALICTSCGGTLQYEQSTIDRLFTFAGGVFTFTGGPSNQVLKCEYCGHRFEKEEKVQPGAGSINIAVVNGGGAAAQGDGSTSVTGIFVGGNINGGTFIMGNGNSVKRRGNNGGNSFIIGNGNSVDDS